MVYGTLVQVANRIKRHNRYFAFEKAENCLEILEACCGEEELDLVYYRDGEERSLKVPIGNPKGE